MHDKETSEFADQIGFRDLLLLHFFVPEMVTSLVEEAEAIRLRLPEITSFHIKEQNTIQFVLD